MEEEVEPLGQRGLRLGVPAVVGAIRFVFTSGPLELGALAAVVNLR